jgi:hypothetical protein
MKKAAKRSFTRMSYRSTYSICSQIKFLLFQLPRMSHPFDLRLKHLAIGEESSLFGLLT